MRKMECEKAVFLINRIFKALNVHPRFLWNTGAQWDFHWEWFMKWQHFKEGEEKARHAALCNGNGVKEKGEDGEREREREREREEMACVIGDDIAAVGE